MVQLDRHGPWALVTGASSGIGQAFAIQLANKGFRLVLVARSEARLHATKELCASSPEVRLIPADLRDAEQVRQLLTDVRGHEIGLAVLSAGFGDRAELLSADQAFLEEMVDLNCRSVLSLAIPIAKSMQPRRKGGVIFLSSLVSWQGVPMSATYAATKAFVQSLAEASAVEWRPHGIDVLSVAPGPVSTEFGAVASMSVTGGVSAEMVAKESLLNLGRKTTLAPGFQSKFLTLALSTAPRPLRVRIMRKVMQGMAPK